MRAVYSPNNKFEKNIILFEKEALHHLNNVLRIKAGDELLILDGVGGRARYHVTQISREKIELNRIGLEMTERLHRISVLLGVPKKDYLEDVFRSCVQMGINEIYLWESKFSQANIKLKEDRIEKILRSSYEQSNNPFDLKIKLYKDLDFDFFENKIIMSVSQSSDFDKFGIMDLSLPTLLAVGPEGGFSPEEDEFLTKDKGFETLHLKTPILKTTQAVPAGIGALLGASMATQC